MLRKYLKLGNELSINNNTKSPQIYRGFSFGACQKKTVEFTDADNTIYWPTNIAKKAASSWKNFSIRASTKYFPI